MVKLIYRYEWGNDGCSGTEICPFEYKGKDEFVYDIIKRFDKKYFKKENYVDMFGQYLNENDIKNMKDNVFTLEEWFIKEKKITFAL
jgi:hypothetical protein